ncbi:MAG: ABC transporter permease [Anaerobacillus sp.]|uniref:ABC transporter permease n=1 Tax=Anaerobacillus sp. TaxID=1872506 RepID=UPI00391C5FEF
MNSIQKLWSKRAKEYWNMAIRYLRLIGNSGFLFAIYIAIIVGSYYYSELLKWLPDWFPATIFLAVITALLLTKSPLRTFIKEGDLVFLSPVEGRLASYFRSSFYYSFIIQSFVLVLVIVLLTPLYRHFIADDAMALLFVIIVLFVSKAWNLLAQWEEGRLLFTGWRITHKLGRFVINATLTYFLFAGASIYFLLAIFAIKVLLLFFYYQHLKKQHSLKWEYLIELEERMVMSFYRIANMFTDVPKLSTKVKRRNPWSAIPNMLAFKQESTFNYLYLKSFIRANDYFGIYVRLLIIGIVLVFYVQFDYGKLFISILLLYMSALQLSTLWNHHQLKIMTDLYPIEDKVRERSFRTVVFSLLVVKTVVFTSATIVATMHFIEPLLVFGIGIIGSYVYSYILLLKKKE